jgi:hypothetical protein
MIVAVVFTACSGSTAALPRKCSSAAIAIADIIDLSGFAAEACDTSAEPPSDGTRQPSRGSWEPRGRRSSLGRLAPASAPVWVSAGACAICSINGCTKRNVFVQENLRAIETHLNCQSYLWSERGSGRWVASM